MKKILLLNLFCALLFGVQTANARYVQLYEGNFPDPIFRDYVSQLTHVAVLDFISEEQLNAVDKIDVHNKGISSLKGIEFFEKLAILNCSGNNITTLSFYGNRLLQLIDCSGNNLTSIDVSMLPLLREFECSANKLSQIILPSNSILNRLGCDYNKLSSLDLSMQSNLLVLTCTYNLLTSLDVSKSSKLQTLYCNNNRFTIYIA